MVYYALQVLALAQADLIPHAFQVHFDADALLNQVSHSNLGFEGNVLEEPEYEWWLGIWEDLVHTRPPVHPPMLLPPVPAEVDDGEGTDTYDPRAGEGDGQVDGGAGYT